VPNVALLVITDCSLSPVGGTSAVLQLANKLNRAQGASRPEFRWRVVSQEGGAVVTGTQLTIATDAAIGVDIYDVVCIPTLYYRGRDSFALLLQQHRPLCEWLRRQWEGGAVICASGTGTFLLAESGLLDGRRAVTVHWLADRFRRLYPEVRLQRSLITEDERLLCSSASTTYLRMAQRLVALFMGPQLAAECAKAILLDAGLSGDATQVPNYMDPTRHDSITTRVNDWAEHHLGQGAGVEELAEALAMSVRTLHRHVLKDTGMTPAAYLQQRRIEAACRLLESTDLSVYEIARRVGYSDSSALSRVFTRSLGAAPAQYRNQFRMDFL
jgi:transcriptional regulator GlxA family with amidase domain